MLRLTRCIALAVVAAISACSSPAEISSPISAPSMTPSDPRLVGTWYMQTEDETGWDADSGVLLSIQRHDNGFLIAKFAWLPGMTVVTAIRTAYPSVVDGVTYFNSWHVDSLTVGKVIGEPAQFLPFAWTAPHPGRGYWIVRAEIGEEGELNLALISDDSLKNLGLRGRKISCGKECDFTRFELSSEELVRLLRETDPDELFGGFHLAFRRVAG